jgi:hypothetical protein
VSVSQSVSQSGKRLLVKKTLLLAFMAFLTKNTPELNSREIPCLHVCTEFLVGWGVILAYQEGLNFEPWTTIRDKSAITRWPNLVEAFGNWKPLSLTYPTTNVQSYGGVHSFASFHLFCFVLFCFVFSLPFTCWAYLGVEKSNPDKAFLYNTKVQGHGVPLSLSISFLLFQFSSLCMGIMSIWA